MTTTVTVTGTGTPMFVPGRAGPGVLVRRGSTAFQFDAGRATTLRLAEAGLDLADLAAVFVTHHHSDHLVGLTDLLFTRWLEDTARAGQPPLPVVAPDGPAADLVERLLDPWHAEVEMRASHTSRPDRPAPQVQRFTARPEPQEVFTAGDFTVSAVAVRHQPVVPAVAYRVDGPDGAVAVSGDTAVCPEFEALARGASVVVHEAFRPAAVAPGMLSDPAALAAYHADTVALGGMAARAGIATLVLTHLIPPPRDRAEREGYVSDVRAGGFGGDVIVAEDLATVTL